MYIKKYFLLFIIIIPVIFLTACWNRVEMSERSLVMATGIDLIEDDKVMITVQVLRPEVIGVPAAGEGGGDSETAVWVTSSTGYTVFEAIRNIVRQSGRKLFWQYSKVLIINEDAAKKGVLPLIEFFVRDHELRLTQKVLISTEKAKDILDARHSQEMIPAIAILDMVRAFEVIGSTVDVSMFEFIGMLSTRSRSSFVSKVELLEGVEGNSSDSENEGEDGKMIQVTGAAVLKDDKFIGFLDDSETRGLNWILGDIVSGILVLKSPVNENELISIEIIRASSRILPEITDGNFIMNLEVSMEGNLGEQHSRADLTRSDRWSSLEKRSATVIENEIKKVLHKAQIDYKADIFGFGEEIYRKFPDKWKEIEDDWEEIFSQIEVKIKVDANLRRYGIIGSPIMVD